MKESLGLDEKRTALEERQKAIKREKGETDGKYVRKKEAPAQIWKKGQSGNPKGRPRGSKNKLTILREAVLANAEHIVLDSWEEVVRTTIAMAKQGDSTALKILWDRVIPAKRAIEEKAKDDKLTININVEKMDSFEVDKIFGDKVVDGEIVEETDEQP